MKVVERADATPSLAECAAEIGSGPLVVTSQEQPVMRIVREMKE